MDDIIATIVLIVIVLSTAILSINYAHYQDIQTLSAGMQPNQLR